MLRPTAPSSFRLREKASVFLAELHPAPGPAIRDAILASLRRRDHDATHHCSAWREGLPVTGFGADDDGEPGGTAGRPMLKVLEGAELTDGLLVCIRWFGGTKLGTGGLVKAYTEAAQGALAEARQAGLLETLRELRHGAIRVAAAEAHLPFAVLAHFPGLEITRRDFGPLGLAVSFTVPIEQAASLERAWQDRSRGGQVEWTS